MGQSNNSRQLTTGAVALAGALTLLAGAPTGAAAATSSVLCYGISPAGENDCANKAGGYHCAGQSTVDYWGMDWQFVESRQACLEQHGKLHAFEGINPYYADQVDDPLVRRDG